MRPMHVVLAVGLVVGLVLLVLALQAVDPLPPDPAVETGGGTAPEELPGAGPTLISTSPPPPRSVATEPVATDPTELPAELAKTHVVVQGRATYPDGRPASGAAIELLRGDAHQVGGRADADGRFAVRVERPTHVVAGNTTIWARDDAGRTGRDRVWISPVAGIPVEAAAVVLKERYALAVHVSGPDGSGCVANVFVLGGNRQELGVLAAIGTTNEQGDLRVDGLDVGSFRVLAVAAGAGRGHAMANVLADEPSSVHIQLPPARDVEVSVVAADGGAPVPDARLVLIERLSGEGWATYCAYLPQQGIPPTDAAGLTSIRGLGVDEVLIVFVEAPGYAPIGWGESFYDRNTPQVAPDATELRIEMQVPRRLHWPLTDADGPVPPDGTIVRIEQASGAVETSMPETGVVEGGELVADGFGMGHVHALAHAPNATVARLFCRADSTEGHPTSFRPARRVTVRCTRPDGSPATGLWVLLRDQGGNALRPAIQVDEQGVANVDGLHGRLADVYVSEVPTSYGGQRIGGVNLAEQGGEFDVVVPFPRQALLRITVDGDPGVPPDLTLQAVGGASFARARGTLQDVDEAAGTVLIPWCPPIGATQQRWNVTASGYPATVIVLESQGGEGPDVFDVPLARGGTLELAIDMPGDGKVQPFLQRYREQHDDWGMVFGKLWDASAPGSPTLRRIEALEPGRYRAADGVSCVASEAVDLVPGQTARLHLRLGQAGIARGRVLGADGQPRARVAVEVRGVDLRQNMPGVRSLTATTKDDGSFEVRVPGDRDVTLVPVHDTLRPAAEQGTVVLRQPRDDIVIRVEESGTFHAVFGRDIADTRSRGGSAKVRVLLFQEDAADPVRETSVSVVDQGITVGGYAPGTYDIWLDVPDAVPVLLTGVKLTDRHVDLGTVETRPGATVRVSILTKEGDAAPRIGLSAWYLGPRAYSRWTTSRGENVVTVAGLGPGSFRVTTNGQSVAALPRIDQTVESDGEGVIELTLDLR